MSDHAHNVKVNIRYKQPGVRGHQFRHMVMPRPMLPAAAWAMEVWRWIESNGGQLISVQFVPAEVTP